MDQLPDFLPNLQPNLAPVCVNGQPVCMVAEPQLDPVFFGAPAPAVPPMPLMPPEVPVAAVAAVGPVEPLNLSDIANVQKPRTGRVGNKGRLEMRAVANSIQPDTWTKLTVLRTMTGSRLRIFDKARTGGPNTGVLRAGKENGKRKVYIKMTAAAIQRLAS